MSNGRWQKNALQMTRFEAGGGGDCMFHAIAYIMSKWLKQPLSMQQVRDELSRCIKPIMAHKFIRRIREDHQSFVPRGAINWNDFEFHSDPQYAITQIDALVRKAGVSFQGTDVGLRQLLCSSKFMRRNSVGAIILNNFGPGHTQIIPTWATFPQRFYLVLYCEGNTHWQAASLCPLGSSKATMIITGDVLGRLMPDL
jgi:hypothetical protein